MAGEIMAQQWQQVSWEEAKQHPLYGVKNWLAVFAFGVLLIPLRELGGLSGAAHDAGMTVTQLLAHNEAFGMYVKAVLALQTLMLVAIYWLMFTKHRSFRAATSAMLFGYWPAVSLLALVTHAPGVGGTIGQGLISWVLSCAVWVTYLQRSRRVRITFENCAAVEKVLSELPPAELMPPMSQTNTAGAPIPVASELTSHFNSLNVESVGALASPVEVDCNPKFGLKSGACADQLSVELPQNITQRQRHKLSDVFERKHLFSIGVIAAVLLTFAFFGGKQQGENAAKR